jgi:hypothetical protein
VNTLTYVQIKIFKISESIIPVSPYLQPVFVTNNIDTWMLDVAGKHEEERTKNNASFT